MKHFIAAQIVMLFSYGFSYGGTLPNCSDDLWRAISNRDFTQIENSLKAGDNPNCAYLENLDITPLDAILGAATWGYVPDDHQTVDLLLRYGAGDSINVASSYGETALLYAAMNGLPKCLTLLLNHGAEINHQNNDGDSALHLNVSYSGGSELDMLLAAGADVNLQDQNGWTPLIQALVPGDTESVRKLIDAKTNLELRDDQGMTALVGTTRDGIPEDALIYLPWLLDAGADVNSRDDRNMTAYGWAKNNRRTQLMEILLKYGGIE